MQYPLVYDVMTFELFTIRHTPALVLYSMESPYDVMTFVFQYSD